ncbi:MAG: hypothetical protein F4X75_13115 [Gemmatimonadetes bacterium]|nr:hypothetical protein [Gemmatimonadota bacterium]
MNEQEKIEQAEGRIMALEFILRQAMAQQGPHSIQALLKNTENARPAGSVPPPIAQAALNGFREQLNEALEQWAKQEAS